MDSWNKHIEQISFRQCITFCEHGQLKGCPPHFQPSVAKNSISTILHCFGCFLLHGNMGPTFARCHNKWPWRVQTKKSNRNFTVRGMTMSCLDRGRTTNFGYRKFRRKIIRIHHLFTTQTSTLTMLSWIVTPDSIIHPYRLSDIFMSWMSLQKHCCWTSPVCEVCASNLP